MVSCELPASKEVSFVYVGFSMFIELCGMAAITAMIWNIEPRIISPRLEYNFTVSCITACVAIIELSIDLNLASRGMLEFSSLISLHL